MDTWTIIAGVGVIVSIIAGVVQVLDYLQERRKKREETTQEGPPSSLPSESEIPHNLPPRSEFIGREAEKARVHEALRSRYPLTSIDGIGGIGKTVLALEVAHECLHASRGNAPSAPTAGIATFDGFIWTTAKDRNLTLNALLDAVARTLDYPGIAQQPVEEKRDAVRKLLQGKSHLLIVDNFETITDAGVRDFLLELPEPSKALITTREQKLHQVWAISLKGLDESEALALIRGAGKRLGLASVEYADDRTLLPLYRATGGAPLAIKWAVGQIKQRGQSLDAVLAALHEARGSVFDNIFTRSWSLLSRSTRRILMVMPLFAASTSREAIETACDVHHFVLDEALGQLVEMFLVDGTDELDLARRRYSIHPLTRAFAHSHLAKQPEYDRAARLRLVHYFEELAEQCGGASWDWQGFDLLEAEKENIMAILSWCREQTLWREIIEIKDRIWNFLHVRGYWHDALRCGLWAVQASRELGDQELLAWHLVFGAGWTYLSQGEFDTAEGMAREALQISERCSYRKSTALALGNLGMIARARGELKQSEEMYRRSRKIWQNLGKRKWAAVALMGLGAAIFQCERYEEAQSVFEQALRENEELGNEEGIGTAFRWLARMALEMRDLQAAKDLYQQSLTVELGLKRRMGIALAKEGLARVSAREGDIDAALRLGRQAHESYRRLGSKNDLERMDAFLETIGAGTEQ